MAYQPSSQKIKFRAKLIYCGQGGHTEEPLPHFSKRNPNDVYVYTCDDGMIQVYLGCDEAPVCCRLTPEEYVFFYPTHLDAIDGKGTCIEDIRKTFDISVQLCEILPDITSRRDNVLYVVQSAFGSPAYNKYEFYLGRYDDVRVTFVADHSQYQALFEDGRIFSKSVLNKGPLSGDAVSIALEKLKLLLCVPLEESRDMPGGTGIKIVSQESGREDRMPVYSYHVAYLPPVESRNKNTMYFAYYNLPDADNSATSCDVYLGQEANPVVRAADKTIQRKYRALEDFPAQIMQRPSTEEQVVAISPAPETKSKTPIQKCSLADFPQAEYRDQNAIYFVYDDLSASDDPVAPCRVYFGKDLQPLVVRANPQKLLLTDIDRDPDRKKLSSIREYAKLYTIAEVRAKIAEKTLKLIYGNTVEECESQVIKLKKLTTRELSFVDGADVLFFVKSSVAIDCYGVYWGGATAVTDSITGLCAILTFDQMAELQKEGGLLHEYSLTLMDAIDIGALRIQLRALEIPGTRDALKVLEQKQRLSQTIQAGNYPNYMIFSEENFAGQARQKNTVYVVKCLDGMVKLFLGTLSEVIHISKSTYETEVKPYICKEHKKIGLTFAQLYQFSEIEPDSAESTKKSSLVSNSLFSSSSGTSDVQPAPVSSREDDDNETTPVVGRK